ncbi:MAG: hypothetical protein AVO35_01060 [Candidatus Aegiribacteria sp. MLS_C]|nr:MAG: hypothetical protein AVO35_01060 [Candidatus Aegiribacteria sp. MLS_C]
MDGILKVDGVLEVRIGSLGNDVGGVSPSRDRKTVFVQGALPGELVRCRPVKEAGSFIKAELLQVLEPSSRRVEPFCPVFGTCGGCSLQHLEYGEQLRWKREWVIRAMERCGIGLESHFVEEAVPSPEARNYRNRVSFDMTPEGPGLHMRRGDPVAVPFCPLLNRTGLEAFSRLSGRALPGCRRVSVRASDRTGRSMVEFSELPPGGIPDLGEGVAAAWPRNGRWEYGSKAAPFTEELAGCSFRIGPGCFFQVNTGAAGILVEKVLGLLPPGGRILDLYGGCGTFALPAAASGARVVSVEMDKASSESGRASAAENGLKNVEFVTCRSRQFLVEDLKDGQAWDAVIVDPPRAGLGVRDARLLRRMRTPLIVYVSCNPFSLARDLGIICERDWKVAGITPVDMFPQTDHVETLTELRRAGRG